MCGSATSSHFSHIWQTKRIVYPSKDFFFCTLRCSLGIALELHSLSGFPVPNHLFASYFTGVILCMEPPQCSLMPSLILIWTSLIFPLYERVLLQKQATSVTCLAGACK